MPMKKRALSTTRIILIGFLITILLGSLLLSLPISSASKNPVPYIDALFTATTATCVTGLVTVTTAHAWSFFGQAVILLLIQIGGLGVITIMSAFMIMLGKKISLGNRMLIMDSFNLNSMSGLVQFIKKVVLGSLIIEAMGAMLYMIVFIPEFGLWGIWISVFNAVSAFCNAGMDIISESSLYNYVENPLINIVTSLLIIIGGLGFIVWWDIIRILKNKHTRHFRYLTLHSKIVLTATLILIVSGAVLIFIFEYTNPLTIGNLSLSGKIQASLFQSVTTRTAGFASVPQEHLTLPSVLICLLLMFIGGSPAGTAGGIKTVTFFVILCTAFSVIKGKRRVGTFNRSLSENAINKAMAVCTTSFIILFVSTLMLSLCCNAPFSDIVYETVSATATVGLSRNLTASLNLFGKIIITATMYFGRVGPISFAIALGSGRENGNIVTDPIEEISVG
ncbi:MAG: potassium transporter KtrB [Clostridia bacterium]|nr:potassium transporter KtrB [Clostridia bacterium]